MAMVKFHPTCQCGLNGNKDDFWNLHFGQLTFGTNSYKLIHLQSLGKRYTGTDCKHKLQCLKTKYDKDNLNHLPPVDK